MVHILSITLSSLIASVNVNEIFHKGLRKVFYGQCTIAVIRLGGDFPEPPSLQLLASSMILEMGSGEIGPGRILYMMTGILEGGGLVIRSSSSCSCCAGEIGRYTDISWGLTVALALCLD